MEPHDVFLVLRGHGVSKYMGASAAGCGARTFWLNMTATDLDAACVSGGDVRTFRSLYDIGGGYHRSCDRTQRIILTGPVDEISRLPAASAYRCVLLQE